MTRPLITGAPRTARPVGRPGRSRGRAVLHLASIALGLSLALASIMAAVGWALAALLHHAANA